jgi:hypothetical protein
MPARQELQVLYELTGAREQLSVDETCISWPASCRLIKYDALAIYLVAATAGAGSWRSQCLLLSTLDTPWAGVVGMGGGQQNTAQTAIPQSGRGICRTRRSSANCGRRTGCRSAHKGHHRRSHAYSLQPDDSRWIICILKTVGIKRARRSIMRSFRSDGAVGGYHGLTSLPNAPGPGKLVWKRKRRGPSASKPLHGIHARPQRPEQINDRHGHLFGNKVQRHWLRNSGLFAGV